MPKKEEPMQKDIRIAMICFAVLFNTNNTCMHRRKKHINAKKIAKTLSIKRVVGTPTKKAPLFPQINQGTQKLNTRPTFYTPRTPKRRYKKQPKLRRIQSTHNAKNIEFPVIRRGVLEVRGESPLKKDPPPQKRSTKKKICKQKRYCLIKKMQAIRKCKAVRKKPPTFVEIKSKPSSPTDNLSEMPRIDFLRKSQIPQMPDIQAKKKRTSPDLLSPNTPPTDIPITESSKELLSDRTDSETSSELEESRETSPITPTREPIDQDPLAKKYAIATPRPEPQELLDSQGSTPQARSADITPRFIRMRRISTKSRLFHSDIDFSILSNALKRRKKKKGHELLARREKLSVLSRKNKKVPHKLVPATDKKIFEVMGAVIVYDLRGFTNFASHCTNDEIPARLIMNIYQFADNVVYEWDGEIISRTGDGFVAIFPRKRSEPGKQGIKKALKRAFKCSAVLVYKTTMLLEKIKLKYKPKRCAVGIEVGPTPLFRNERFNELAGISAVSSTINHAQRCESHSKRLLHEVREYRPIVMKEALFNLISDNEGLQRVFREKGWYNQRKGKYYKQLMNEAGIPPGTFACACPIKNIIRFYKENKVKLRNKKRTLMSTIQDLLNQPK